MLQFLTELFALGGMFVYAITACLVYLVFLTIKKSAQLWIGQPNGDKLKSMLNEGIKQKRFDDVLVFCKNFPNSSLTKVVEAGVSRFGRDESHIENAISSVVSEEVPKIQNGVATFSFIANISTLFGLLGTITGMIQAFKGVAAESAATKQTLLAEGISEAMHCTASGLFVAVTALIVASWINSRASKMTSDIHSLADKCMEASGSRLYDNNKKSGNVINRHVGAA